MLLTVEPGAFVGGVAFQDLTGHGSRVTGHWATSLGTGTALAAPPPASASLTEAAAASLHQKNPRNSIRNILGC